MKCLCYIKKVAPITVLFCGIASLCGINATISTDEVVKKIQSINSESNIVKKIQMLRNVFVDLSSINFNEENLTKIGEISEILLDRIFKTFNGLSALPIEDATLVKSYINSIVSSNFLQKYYKDEIIQRVDPVMQWIIDGKAIPPCPAVKHLAIMEYKTKFGCKIFVETGTYKGDMVDAQKNNFKQIYSIELGETLASDAAKRFQGLSHIKIIQGDSGKILKKLVTLLKEPALFWLDTHFSGGDTINGDTFTPIMEELNSILSQNVSHIILIDDARDFTGENDYPTIAELTKFVKIKRPNLNVEVKDDMIRITPQIFNEEELANLKKVDDWVFSNKNSLSNNTQAPTNSDKHVVGARGAGFFSEFLGVLGHIEWCEESGKKPVALWNNNFVYYEPDGWNNTQNAWEYYFEPLSDAKYEPNDIVDYQYSAPNGFRLPFCDFSDIEKIRPLAHDIIKKYIKIKPYVLDIVDDFYNKNMKNCITIGIHLRGTNKCQEVNTVINPTDVIEKAQKYASLAASTGKKVKYLIASDEQKLIDFAKNELCRSNGNTLIGDVISYATERSKGDETNYLSFVGNKKENGFFAKRGLDVLVEVLLLARCSYFVHTISNVSVAVVFFNPDLTHYQFDGFARVQEQILSSPEMTNPKTQNPVATNPVATKPAKTKPAKTKPAKTKPVALKYLNMAKI